jgi:hypothetical protein
MLAIQFSGVLSAIADITESRTKRQKKANQNNSGKKRDRERGLNGKIDQ